MPSKKSNPDLVHLTFDSSVPEEARAAIIDVLNNEGGYVFDENDKGGETKYGITKRWYPEMDIKTLSISEAAKIYFDKYWKRNQCHYLEPELAVLVFDCAVNCGGVFARRTLQEALNVEVDGIIGSATLGASASAEVRNQCTQIAIKFTRIRQQHYIDLVKSDYSQIKFLNGWLNRALDVLAASMRAGGS